MEALDRILAIAGAKEEGRRLASIISSIRCNKEITRLAAAIERRTAQTSLERVIDASSTDERIVARSADESFNARVARTACKLARVAEICNDIAFCTSEENLIVLLCCTKVDTCLSICIRELVIGTCVTELVSTILILNSELGCTPL